MLFPLRCKAPTWIEICLILSVFLNVVAILHGVAILGQQSQVQQDGLLLEFDSPKGHVEVDLEIHPSLINGKEPYVNQSRPNRILIESEKEGRQQVLIYIRPKVVPK